MKKRIISGLLCATMASALLVGCGESAESGATTSDESGSGTAGSTITIMASQDWIEDSEQELGAKFEEETGIHVDYQILPADQYQDVLLTRLNSGEGPDMFMAQSGFAMETTYKVQ